MAFWLLVERIENWRVDKSEGFRRFGIPERKRKLAESIRTGDQLISYVSSGHSSFADVRMATQDGIQNLRMGGDYDTAYPLAIATEPVLTLEPEAWVPIRTMTEELTFTRGKDWRQLMRVSFRPLIEGDAKKILAAMKLAAR